MLFVNIFYERILIGGVKIRTYIVITLGARKKVENADIWRPNPTFKVKEMADYNVSMRDLLQAGAHFGHQTRFWNPKCVNTFLARVKFTSSTLSTLFLR